MTPDIFCPLGRPNLSTIWAHLITHRPCRQYHIPRIHCLREVRHRRKTPEDNNQFVYVLLWVGGGTRRYGVCSSIPPKLEPGVVYKARRTNLEWVPLKNPPPIERVRGSTHPNTHPITDDSHFTRNGCGSGKGSVRAGEKVAGRVLRHHL